MEPVTPPSEDTNDSSFMSHLIELRSRLLKAGAAVLAMFIVLCIYPGAATVYDVLALPMSAALPEGAKMIATGVISPLITPLKVTIMVAFVLVLPIVLYQVWAFVAPGLYRHERRFALPLIVSSTLLFFAGMAFCYFVVFGTVFHLIASVAPASVTPTPDIESYISFVLSMFFAFGVAFEVPVVVVLLVKVGIVNLEQLKKSRGYVIVSAFVVAAVVTPPDALSQIMLAVPLCLLYELGLLCARWVEPKPDAEDTQPSTEIDPRT